MSDLISRTEAIKTLNAYFVDMCSEIERWDMEQLLHAINPQPDPRDAVIKGLVDALAELLQVNDGVPMLGIEASRRISVARAALAAVKGEAK